MTKRKILWLIALAIMVVMFSVACKKKPTNVDNFMSVEEPSTPEFPSDNTNKKLPIDTNQGLIQFKGLSFKSGGYILNGDFSKIIYFYADVKVDSESKPYISAVTKDTDGNIIEEEGKFYNNLNETGAVYNLEGVRYQSHNKNTAVATFVEDGYLRIKFSNYGTEFTYSLIGKSDEVEEPKDELKDYIGSYQSTVNYSFAGYGTFKYGAKLTEYETGKYRLELTGGQYNNRKPNRDETKDKNGLMAFHDWHTFLIRFSADGNTLYVTFPSWSRPVEMKKIK